jgi:hypothetical protein
MRMTGSYRRQPKFQGTDASLALPVLERRHELQFMVIERFRNQDAKAIYQRLHDRGRMMPDGLTFVNSWVAADLGRCFQLMEADDVTLFQRWIATWSDLMEFEVVPAVPGGKTAEALAAQLQG